VPTPAPAMPGVAVAPPVAAPLAASCKTRLVILVDNLHLTPANRNRVLKNVDEFARANIKCDVEGMIVTFNRSLKVRRKFTNDGRDLYGVLRQIEEESALGVTTLGDRRELIQRIDDSQSADSAIQSARSYAESIANDLKFTIDA